MVSLADVGTTADAAGVASVMNVLLFGAVGTVVVVIVVLLLMGRWCLLPGFCSPLFLISMLFYFYPTGLPVISIMPERVLDAPQLSKVSGDAVVGIDTAPHHQAVLVLCEHVWQ